MRRWGLRERFSGLNVGGDGGQETGKVIDEEVDEEGFEKFRAALGSLQTPGSR